MSNDLLTGIRILEVAEHTFVPLASAILADWGAEVIKIEHPERGDAMRGLGQVGTLGFGTDVQVLVENSNRGKRSLGLDLTDPAAKDDIVTLNQLHMEVNRPILIHLSSKDVIHSFFLPYMRVKQDAIPGQEVAIHFTPVKTGSDGFEIACAQLCGLGHYRMRGQYAVHTKSDFEKWLADNAPAAVSTAAPNPVPAATPAQNPATGQSEPVPGQAPPQ